MARPANKPEKRVGERWCELVPIVLISEALSHRSTVSDGRILRDRVLCGFCVRMKARKRNSKVAALKLAVQ
jgi:hypothetical protein